MAIVDGLIELYEISGGGLPSPLRFCNYSDVGGANVLFDSVAYTAYPIQSSTGWERSLEGALPRPTIVLSNVFSDVSAIVNQYSGIDADVVRKTVKVKNLDNGSDPDPTAIIKEESYKLTRSSWNNLVATLRLRSPLDVENLKLPRRTIAEVLDT